MPRSAASGRVAASGRSAVASRAAATTRLPLTSRLWVGSDAGGPVVTRSATLAALFADSTAAPDITLGAIGRSFTFDTSGNLWTVETPALLGTIKRYTAASFVAGTPTADITVTFGATTNVCYGCAFDASGNLWLSMYADGVMKINASALLASGSTTPSVVLKGSTLGLLGSLTFDAYGNLWVAGSDSLQGVSKFAPSQLLVSDAAITPSVWWHGANFGGPWGFAFDSAGALWVSDYGGTGKASKFPASLFGTSGNVTPTVVLTTSTTPTGIAFDQTGALYVADYVNPGRVRRYTSAQIAATGSPTASATYTGLGTNNALTLAIFPPIPPVLY